MPPSSATPTPSSTSNDTTEGSGGSASAIAAAVSISIVGIIIVGATLYFFWRRRKGSSEEGVASSPLRRHGTVVKPNHPASQISPFPSRAVPFALRTDIPPVAHRPGENMRIATRRSDGGWDFSRPLDLTPTTVNFDTPTTAHFPSRKDRLFPNEPPTRGYVETDVEGLPPPAYCARSSVESP